MLKGKTFWGNVIFRKHGIGIILFSSMLCVSTQIGETPPCVIRHSCIKCLVKATSFIFAMQINRQHGAFNRRRSLISLLIASGEHSYFVHKK